MDRTGRLFRIFIDVGTETGDVGFEVCVREGEQPQRYGAERFWARFVCHDMAALLASLVELKPDGLSRFMRETDQGPLFEHVALGPPDVMNVVRKRCGSSSGHLTLLVSRASVEEMTLRVSRAKSVLVPSSRNVDHPTGWKAAETLIGFIEDAPADMTEQHNHYVQAPPEV